MKKQFIYSLLLLGLTVCSCTEQLNQTPITEKESSLFYSTETEIESAVNGVYGALQATGLYGLYLPVLGEIPSDNTYDQVPTNDQGIFGQLDLFSTITANTLLSTTWRQAYVGIQRANVVLTRIDNVTFSDDKVKQARKGEMKFIRALLYFNLVRIFGDIPLSLQETMNPNDYFGKGRAPATQVYDQIRQDLIDAIAVLPDAASKPGKVTKGAAQTLLAKVYLTQANFQQAKSLLQTVVNSGTYMLLPQLKDVFSLVNENNREIIFAVQFASGINANSEGSPMFQQFSPTGTVSGAPGHNLPTKSVYSLYAVNDLRRGVYLDQTSSGIPYGKKLTQPTTVITDGGSDVVVLRYADVLLMLAEVDNELGNMAAAASSLTMVRVRAGLLPAEASTQASLRDAIALERRLELVGEGHRWFDLLRTGKAIEVMNAWFKSSGINTVIDQHNLVQPIPQDQINTDPALTQNPGY